MKILGIIPARCGSKGIPKKNIKILNGKPLIAYTIQQAQSSKLLSKTIISTDCEEIAKVGEDFGANVPFLRPHNLATDHSASLDYVIHALQYFQELGELYEAICILQPTSPFRPNGVIDDAIKKFISSDADTLISLRKVPNHYNPHWVFFEDEEKNLMVSTSDSQIIPRRQDLPNAFHRDGAIYLIKTETILNKSTLYGDELTGFEIESPELINIDSIDDWKRAEKYIK